MSHFFRFFLEELIRKKTSGVLLNTQHLMLVLSLLCFCQSFYLSIYPTGSIIVNNSVCVYERGCMQGCLDIFFPILQLNLY